MSIPSPKSPLDGRCSAIDNDTLYVLSSGGFQALPLKINATWSDVPQGQVVQNPACVRVAPNGDESQAVLYVVGGTTDDSSYSGLQSYTFSTKQWQTLTLPTSDMVGRTQHSVAYLPQANMILSYAGSQPQAESKFSSQTFVISLTSPYNIRSFESHAPPGNDPILLTFDENSAVLLGSSTRSKEIWNFNVDSGWSQSSTSLAQAIDPAVQALLLDGTDGSKVLTTYDATVSPNVVSQIVLSDAGGTPAKTGQTIGGSSKKRKRDLTLQDWPKYNSSDAPDTVRNGYTVTQDTSGLAVLTGGSSSSPLNIFDNTKNAWVDNGQFFNGVPNDNQVPINTASTTSRPASSSSTPTSSPSSTAPPLIPNSSRARTLRILGIVLGTLCGLAALFIIALLILRWRRQKKQRGQPYINEKGDHMSFQDRGAPFMKEAGGSNVDVSAIPPNHRFTQHNSSHNSFAIMAGKFGRHNSRNFGQGGRGSSESTRQLVKPRKNDIRGPVELDRWGQDKEVHFPDSTISPSGAPQIPASTLSNAIPASTLSNAIPASAMVGAREDNLLSSFVEGKKRSSGWSRYFAGGDPQLPSAYDRGLTTSGYTATTDMTDGSRPSMPSRIPSSALVPPLDLDYTKAGDGQRISRVVTASPSFNHSAEDLARRGSSIEAARGQTARLHTPREHMTPSRDTYNSDGGYSITDTEHSYNTDTTNYGDDEPPIHNGASNWTPVSNAPYDIKPGATRQVGSVDNSPDPNNGAFSSGAPRAPSSAYTASYYGGGPGESRAVSARGNTGFWPSNKDSTLRPSSRTGKRSPENSGVFPTPPGIPRDEERESTLTTFPKGVPSAYYAGRDQARKEAAMAGGPGRERSDMSWLNLGLK